MATRQLAIVLIFVCGLFWGSSFILMKRALLVFSPAQVGALRIIFAGLSILPFILPQLLRRWHRLPKGKLLLSTLIGNLIPAFLFPLAQTQIASGTTGVLNSLTPLFTLVLGVAFFAQPWRPVRILGVVVGLLGASLLILQQGEVGGDVRYALLIVLATLLYGWNTNFVKFRLTGTSPVLITGFGLVMATLPLALWLLWQTDFSLRAHAPGAGTALLALGALGAVGTSLALWLYFIALKHTSAVGASSVTYLIPAVALGWALLDGEPFALGHLWGMALILLGVWLVNKRLKA